METSQIILLVANAIFVIFILFGFLYGVKRGFKKSVYRFIFIAASLLICFIIAHPIANWIMNFNISNIVSLSVDGTQCNTLNDYILALLNSNEQIADMMARSESLKELILQVPVVVLQIFLFVILFWLLKIITHPIYAIVTRNVYKNKFDNKRVVEKHRLLGGTIGVIQGLLIVFVTLLPIGGTLGLIKALDSEEVTTASAYEENSEEAQPKSILRYLLAQMNGASEYEKYIDLAYTYDSSILASMNNATGLEQALYDSITMAKVGDKKIVIRNELKSVNDCYHSYLKLNSINLNNINELNIDAVEKIVNALFDSNILGSFADDLLPYFVDKALKETENKIEPRIYNFLTNYITTYGTPKFASLKQDCLAVVNTLRVLKNNNLFNSLKNNEIIISDVLTLLEKTDTANPIADIVDAMLNSSTLKNVIQESVNLGLSYFDEILTNFAGTNIEVQKVNISNIDWNTERNNIVNLLNNLVDISTDVTSNVKSEDFNKKELINLVSFEKIGNVLETFANSQLFNQAYLNTCDAMEEMNKVSKYMNFEGIKDIRNWSAEFRHFDNIKVILNNAGILNMLINKEDLSNSDISLCAKLLDGKMKLSDEKYITLICNELVDCGLLKSSVPRIINNVLKPKLEEKLEISIESINEENIDWDNEKANFITVMEGLTSNNEIISQALDDNLELTNIINSVNSPKIKAMILAADASQLYGNMFDGVIYYLNTNAKISKYVNLSFTQTYNNQNWENELTHIESAFKLIQDSDLIDNISETENDEILKEIFSYFNSNKVWAKNLISSLYSTDLLQNNLQNYLNQIENKFSAKIGTSITHTTIDIVELNADLENRRNNFSNSIINICGIISDIYEGKNIDIDFVSERLIQIGIGFDSIQNCYETMNIYNALLNYLKNTSSISGVIDFNVVDDNFDWISEMQTLSEIITILKDNDLWEDFKTGGNIENLVEGLNDEQKQQILVKLAESKFFSSSLIKLVNTMLDMMGTYLDISLNHISDDTDLVGQMLNIIDIASDLLVIGQGGTDFNDLDLEVLGSLLDNIKINKFTYNGVFSQLYDELTLWLTNDNNNAYANDIKDAVLSFDSDQPSTKQVYEVAEVQWSKVISLLAINVLIENIEDITGIATSTIPYTTDISDQKDSIDAVVNKALDVVSGSNIDLDSVDREKFGEFMNELKANKFSTTFTGLLSNTYNTLVTWLCANANYGLMIRNAIMCYASNPTQNPHDVDGADWVQIMYLLPYDIINDIVTDFTGENIPYIQYNQTINNSQRESLDSILDKMEELFPDENVDLDSLNKTKFGELLTLLKENKFSADYTGIMGNTYNAIINWLCNDSTYGYLISGIIATYDEGSNLPYNVSAVDWNSIFDAIIYLDNVKNDFTNFSDLAPIEIKSLMYSVSQKALTNNDITDLITIYLTHNETNAGKIAAITNFDWKDYYTFETIIDALDALDAAQNLMDSNQIQALNQIKSVLNSLNIINTDKLNNVVRFIDAVANTDISSKIIDVNFSDEIAVINSLLEISDATTIALQNISDTINSLVNSELVFDELNEGNMVLIDMTDTDNINKLRNSVASDKGLPISEITDSMVVDAIKNIIENSTSNTSTRTIIAKLFNITM